MSHEGVTIFSAPKNVDSANKNENENENVHKYYLQLFK